MTRQLRFRKPTKWQLIGLGVLLLILLVYPTWLTLIIVLTIALGLFTDYRPRCDPLRDLID